MLEWDYIIILCETIADINIYLTKFYSLIFWKPKFLYLGFSTTINIQAGLCSPSSTHAISLFQFFIILRSPFNHGYSLQQKQVLIQWLFSTTNQRMPSTCPNTRDQLQLMCLNQLLTFKISENEIGLVLQDLTLEVPLFWLLRRLSCETAGIFEIINELCNPSNSCSQMKSFQSAHKTKSMCYFFAQ